MSLTAAVLLALSLVVSADNLYPKCYGEELDQRVSSVQGDVKLTNIRGSGTKLYGDCIAFEVTSVAEGSCAVPHQTELPIRVFVRAVGLADKTYLREFDIDDVLGGSINALTFSTSQAASFSVYFRNLHSSSDCLMRVRAIFSAVFLTESEEDQHYAAPSIVNIEPPTVFAHHVNSTSLVFRMEQAPLPTDEVLLIPQTDKCASPNGPTMQMARTTDPSKVAPLLEGYAHPASHTVWQHFFDSSGTFTICYHRSGTTAEAVALLTVYGGNPRYFDVVSGGGPRGELYLFQEIVIRFFGTDLDTRPDGDRAKLVQDTDACDGGAPAGGVALTTDLGPADDWGPQTTHTDWTLTITKGGAYKVCYKRSSGPWTEVPLITDVPSSAIMQRSTTAAPLLVPTDPVNKQPCAVAPSRTEPAIPNSLMRLTLQTKESVPSYFMSLLAQLLCMSTDSVVVFRTTSNAQGHLAVICDIRCDGECDSDERKHYLTYTFHNTPTTFSELKLLDVEEIVSDGLNIVNARNPTSHSGHSHLGALVLICLTIIALAGIGAYGFVVYQRNQHRFIQFGIDDDDDAAEISGDGGATVQGVVPGTQTV